MQGSWLSASSRSNDVCWARITPTRRQQRHCLEPLTQQLPTQAPPIAGTVGHSGTIGAVQGAQKITVEPFGTSFDCGGLKWDLITPSVNAITPKTPTTNPTILSPLALVPTSRSTSATTSKPNALTTQSAHESEKADALDPVDRDRPSVFGRPASNVPGQYLCELLLLDGYHHFASLVEKELLLFVQIGRSERHVSILHHESTHAKDCHSRSRPIRRAGAATSWLGAATTGSGLHEEAKLRPMFFVCQSCGEWSTDRPVVDGAIECDCGHRRPIVLVPMFFLTGASATGKTTVGNELLGSSDPIVLDADMLWAPEMDTPEDGYARFRSTWLRLASNIHQSGRSTLLIGSGVPEQYDSRPERAYVGPTHWMALVCDDDVLGVQHSAPDQPGEG